MPLIQLANEIDFEGWRTAARSLLAQSITPENVKWRISSKIPELFDTPVFMPTQMLDPQLSVPRDFFELCKTAILYRDPLRFDLLYRLLWRIRKERDLLQSLDSDVVDVKSMAQAVMSDLQNMKSSMRFESVHIRENDKLWSGFVAWFEPSHFIVQASGSFFIERLPNTRWFILTPDICMHWDGKVLSDSPGKRKVEEPGPDDEDKIWRAYHRSISDQAWLKVPAMQSQIPKNHWRNLPEAERLPNGFINIDNRKNAVSIVKPIEAEQNIGKSVAKKEMGFISNLDVMGVKAALHRLNIEMLANIEFKLAEYSTQAVLGSGVAPSDIMLLAEQPSELDDLAGELFIGPLGKVLDQALQDAGMERPGVYVTNLLKHFKFRLQGFRRLPLKPGVENIKIYLPWLQGEIDIVQPRLIVAMGSMAAHTMTGKTPDMEVDRGKIFPVSDGRQVLVTYHPAFILGTSDKATRRLRYETLVADLKLAAKVLISTIN